MSENTIYLVDIADSEGDRACYAVTAAKPTYDDRYWPGFIQLRDGEGDLVALVPIGAHPLIRRQDSDPTMAKRSAAAAAPPRPPVPRPPQTPASRAALEQLAARGSKPGDV
jgi:hypothetical protein